LGQVVSETDIVAFKLCLQRILREPEKYLPLNWGL
jgi:hypothetical protein